MISGFLIVWISSSHRTRSNLLVTNRQPPDDDGRKCVPDAGTSSIFHALGIVMAALVELSIAATNKLCMVPRASCSCMST